MWYRLFWRRSRDIVIGRSSLSSLSCKNFNITHYSKGIKTKLAHHGNVQLQDKGNNSKSYILLELCPLLTKIFQSNDGPWQTRFTCLLAWPLCNSFLLHSQKAVFQRPCTHVAHKKFWNVKADLLESNLDYTYFH